VEHILPRGLGGGNNDENLTVICSACNHARGHTYSDLLVNVPHTSEDVISVVQFLHLQLEYQVKSSIQFPELYARFRKHWEKKTETIWVEGREEAECRDISMDVDMSQTLELLRKREQLSRPRKSVGVGASLGRRPSRYRRLLDGARAKRAERNRISRQNATEYSRSRRGIPDSKNSKEEEE